MSFALREGTQQSEAIAQAVGQQTSSAQEDAYSVLLTSLGVELPVSTPKVFVNQSGYITDREKIAVFWGEGLSDEFRVVRKSDKEIVYTGKLEQGGRDALSGEYLSVGDFTEVTETGTYYIETDIIGQSYSFSISQDGYENLFVGLLKNASDTAGAQDAESVINIGLGMNVLLYAMQCNGTLFEEAYNYFGEDDKQLVTQLLYLASELCSVQGEDGSIYGDYEATAVFCGIMAYCRYSFGKYDDSVSKEYKEAVDAAWEWMSKQSCDTEQKEEALFYAAAQLFKLECSDEYKGLTQEFINKMESGYADSSLTLYGVIAYMGAENNADRDLCTYIMKDLTDYLEELCADAKTDELFGTGLRSADDSLRMLMLLSFVNYITPVKEYTDIIENIIQYMGGLNDSGVCYVDADGAWTAASDATGRTLEWNGIMIFGVSELLSNIV